MKGLFLSVLLFTGILSFAQNNNLKQAVANLDNALIKKDTAALRGLLHQEATYGHSNGWVQTKSEVLDDVVSGKLSYIKIESSDYKWVENKSWATVRSTTKAQFILNGTTGEAALHVLEVWIKSGNNWQLVARQATKLPENK